MKVEPYKLRLVSARRFAKRGNLAITQTAFEMLLKVHYWSTKKKCCKQCNRRLPSQLFSVVETEGDGGITVMADIVALMTAEYQNS